MSATNLTEFDCRKMVQLKGSHALQNCESNIKRAG